MAEPLVPAAAPPPVASHSPFACRLALKLVEHALGPVCRQVVQCLIDHGTQQYADLVRRGGLPLPQLRAGLLVLIQHNYVNAYLKEEAPTLRGAGPSYSLYEAALPRILQGLRVPRFLIHITDELGAQSAGLVRLLLEEGRLRADQLLEAATALQAPAGAEGGSPADPEVLRNQFRSLVIERFVERVPPCTLPPPPTNVHPNARKRVSAPKPGSEEEAALHREQQEAAKRQEYQQVRFTLPDDLAGGDGDAPGSGGAAGKPGKRKRGAAGSAGEEPSKKRGRKKGGDAAAAKDAAAAAGGSAAGLLEGEDGDGPVLWRVNYDEFNRRFRNDVVIETVKLKHGADAGQAVAGLLAANARFEQTAQAGDTVVLSVNEVAAALRRQYGAAGVPDNLAAVLGELAEDDLYFLDPRGQGPGGEQYVMHIPQVLQLARLLEVQAVVRNKFGAHGMRIWRLLLLQGQLEQKQVADLAMVTKEEAREALYAMLKAGYLALQDVPRTTDHAPSRTFYTWRVNVDAAIRRVASDLYRAAGNVHARMLHELERRKELLELVEEDNQQSAVVAERRGDELESLKRVSGRLEAALLDLDRQICIFADV